MTTRRCPGCGKPFRSGKAVTLVTAEGHRSAIVCAKCAAGGLVIVWAKYAESAKAAPIDGLAILTQAVKALRVRAKLANTGAEEYDHGYKDASESAAETITRMLAQAKGKG